MKEQKIRIRLKAYDYKLLDRSVEEIVDTAKRNQKTIPVSKVYHYDEKIIEMRGKDL